MARAKACKESMANGAKKRPPRAVEHLDYLSLVAKCKSKQARIKLLELAQKGQLEAILECIDNVNRGAVSVPASKVRALRRHSRLVRRLKERGTSLSTKKQLLGQSGGFLGTLLPVAVQAVGSLFSNLLRPRQ